MSEDKIRKIFSKNLTNQLSMHGKTQKDLVDFIHVSSSTVSNWCTGQKLPRMDKIQAIANWLGINTSDLIEEKSNVPRQLELDISEEILKIIAKIASDNSTVVYGNSEPLKSTELKIVKEELEMARRRLEILTKK
ncbi:helix-turn-helix transcriptional regulator [[Clostridium] symbiosum]|uniref:helix-turn-helix domain-containing protein n=1 Tax=Clostridium symbiosum TaxID=1512 RepID=UPI00156DFA47|nr:helix-turn-helix transcriptional regulator [[Clostridium] symbiosum]NSI96361.1 helix-turn-helix transcriptional regulator [[Clostridium] symbiosum]